MLAKRAVVVFLVLFISFSTGGSPRVAAQTTAPFCFPTRGTLGFRFNERAHRGIDIWTGGWPEDVPPPGNPIHLVHGGKLEMILEGRESYPDGPRDGVPQALVFSHEVAPSFADTVPHLEVNTWYIHLANQETGESYVNPDLRVGRVYPRGTFLGYQGDRKYYQTESLESDITHLHFDIRLPNNSTEIDPSPYLGFSLNYDDADVLSKGTEFDNTCSGENLSVSLTADPSDGPAPLDTELTAVISGSATGTINYTFWWDCDDSRISVEDVMEICGYIPTPNLGSCEENENGIKCDAVAGESKTVSHTYEFAGDYTAKVIAERGGAPPAEDRTSIAITSPNLPDLIVEDIWTDPDPPTPGSSTWVWFRIKNQGTGDATGAFYLEFYFDGNYVGHTSTGGLVAGATHASKWLRAWPPDVNPHTVRGVVDADGSIPESDEGNNERTESFSASTSTTSTPSPTVTYTPTGSPTPTATQTPTSTNTPTSTEMPTHTSTATSTRTPTPTWPSSPTLGSPTVTGTATRTLTPTSTTSPTETTTTATPTNSPTATATYVPTPATTPTWFEGWEAAPIGNPPCEVSLEGFTNCAFAADSGQWLVTELRDSDIPIGDPIGSVEISPGKILKLQLTTDGREGHVTGRSVFSSLNPGTIISFTDHGVELGDVSQPSHVIMTVYFDAPGASVPCPGTDVNMGDTYISYVFESNAGFELPSPDCAAAVDIGPVTTFSRDLYDDFVSLLPFSPDGWTIHQLTLRVVPGDPTVEGIWSTWDNISIWVNAPACYVGMDDIQYVVSLWHQDADPPYDCDGDGVITVEDIMCWVALLGEPCP